MRNIYTFEIMNLLIKNLKMIYLRMLLSLEIKSKSEKKIKDIFARFAPHKK